MLTPLLIACLGAAPLQPVAFDAGLPTDGQWRNGFDLADMNGDGHLDLVHGPPRKGKGRPVIFLGDGAGTWHEWTEARFPDLTYDYGDAAAADFNGDGHTDVALAMHMHGFLVLANDGKGQFTKLETELPYGVPPDFPAFSSRALATVDWNDDGRVDLIAVGEGPLLSLGRQSAAPVAGNRGMRVFLQTGGVWPAVTLPNATVFGDGLAVGDINGDGRVDAVSTSNVMGNVGIVALNDGASPTIAGLPDRVLITAVTTVPKASGPGVDVVAAWTAWDEDGAMKHGLSRVAWHDEEMIATARVTDLTSPVSALVSGDFDGDGNADIASGDGEGTVRLWRVNEGSWESVELSDTITGPGRCYHMTTAPNPHSGTVLFAEFARETDMLANALQSTGDARPSGGSIRAWTFAPTAPAEVAP